MAAATPSTAPPTSFRRLGRDIAIYGGGDLLLRGTAFITIPIYTHLLSPSAYGVLGFAATVTSLLSVFLVLGCDAAYARYHFDAGDPIERRQVASTAVAFVGAWSTVVTLLCIPLAAVVARWEFGSSHRAVAMIIAVVSAPLIAMNALLGQTLRNDFRAGSFALLAAATAALSVTCSVVAVVGFDAGVSGILAGTLIAAAVMLPVRVWMSRRYLSRSISSKTLRSLLMFGLPLVPTAIATWIFDLSDRVIVGRLASTRELGLYSVAITVSSIIALLTISVGQAWSPHAFRIYTEMPELAPAFYGRMLTYILSVFGLGCVAVSGFARQIIRVITTPAYYGAAGAVIPLALGIVAYASIQVTAAGISLTRRTGYFALYSWIAALLNVGLNLLLVPRFGMIAAAWSTFVAYCFLTLAYLVTAQRLWAVRYEARRAFFAVVLIVGFALPGTRLPGGAGFLGAAAAILWTCLFLVALLITGVVGPRELDAMRSALQTARGKMTA